MKAPCLMVQGTSSHVGKSIIAAAFCRIFRDDGYRVCPFKSQNMSLNSFVTREGGEMGRAQVVQAEAAGIEPSVDMNPILLKPEGEKRTQVVVMGKPIGQMQAEGYYDYKNRLWEVIKEALDRIRSGYDLIVMEGAGSPAEINLKENDIVNMKMAELADAPVILVADIDRGGVFASIVGTLELLDPPERDRIQGFIINKFRGDLNLLTPGLDTLEKRTQKPVLGVIPYFHDIDIDEEDSVALEDKNITAQSQQAGLEIAVIQLPRISNFTDFTPFKKEGGVFLYYVTRPEEMKDPDLVIIPGSKSTIADLKYLKTAGFPRVLQRMAGEKKMIVGICGGFQMLGKEIRDPLNVESDHLYEEGLGLLNIISTFEATKATHQVKARAIAEDPGFLGETVSGYEIHMGRTELSKGVIPVFTIFERSGEGISRSDGAVSPDGRIWGSYIHGLFDNALLRRRLLDRLRKERGLKKGEKVKSDPIDEYKDRQYDKLARLVRDNLDMKKIYRIIGNNISG